MIELIQKYDLNDLFFAYINVMQKKEKYIILDDVISWYVTTLVKVGEKYIDLQYPERFIGESEENINYIIDYMEPLSEYSPAKTNKKISKRKALNQVSKHFDQFYENRNITNQEKLKKLRLSKIK